MSKTIRKCVPKNQAPYLTALVPAVIASTSLSLHATGFDAPDQDAFAVARGMAVVATADNPSAIYYNPAGITQLPGDNVRGGVYGIYLDPTYQPPGSSTTFDNQKKLHAIPELFYTHGFTNLPVSLGLGLYTPFGLSEKWPQNTGFRTVATQGSLTEYTINPVAAFQLPWHISLAAGLMVNYSSVNLQQGLTPVPNNDLFAFKGDAWALGYNLGARWEPLEQLSLGASFRSSTTMDYSGHTETQSNGGPLPIAPDTDSPASVNFPFPLEANVGVSYRPTEKWNVEFDAQYTDWSALGNLTIHQTPAATSLLPYPTIPLALDWESSWDFEWGVTRYFDNGWRLSAGYIFNENSVPNAHYTPLVSDLDRHFFSVGTGYQGKHFNFDVAYQFGYGPDHTVVGSPTPTGYPPGYHPADGTYAFISHAIMLSVGWRL